MRVIICLCLLVLISCVTNKKKERENGYSISEDFKVICSIELQDGFNEDTVSLICFNEILLNKEIVESFKSTYFSGIKIQLLEGAIFGKLIRVKTIGKNRYFSYLSDDQFLKSFKIKLIINDDFGIKKFEDEISIHLEKGKYIGLRKGVKKDKIVIFYTQSDVPYIYH